MGSRHSHHCRKPCRPHALLALLTLCLILAGCAPTTPEATFQNPVLRENFADPFILSVDGTYWLYATNASGRNISLARSTNLLTWEILGDAMPALPK